LRTDEGSKTVFTFPEDNKMLPIRNDLHTVDKTSFDYIYEENATIQLANGRGIVRCNVYRPKTETEHYPVLVTYGPYGKDVHYSVFHASSFADVPDEHHSPHSAWYVRSNA